MRYPPTPPGWTHRGWMLFVDANLAARRTIRRAASQYGRDSAGRKKAR